MGDSGGTVKFHSSSPKACSEPSLEVSKDIAIYDPWGALKVMAVDNERMPDGTKLTAYIAKLDI
jgi:hypothetical protein